MGAFEKWNTEAFDTPSWHLTYGPLIKFKAILTKGI